MISALLLLLGAVQEVELLEQVVEAVGVQDDGDEVRVVALVARAQLVGEQRLRLVELAAQAREPRPLGVELALGGRQRVLLAGRASARTAASRDSTSEIWPSSWETRPLDVADAGAQALRAGLGGAQLRVQVRQRGAGGGAAPAARRRRSAQRRRAASG